MTDQSKPLTQMPLKQLINGDWMDGTGREFAVLDKFRLTPITSAKTAGPEQIAEMIEAAEAAFRGGVPEPYDRGAVLDRAAVLMGERASEVAAVIQAESGFTAADAQGEVTRCIQTLRLSAEEARRLAGEVIPMTGAPGQSGRIGFTLRVPLGIVFAVTPFNSPLNTVTHKVAPAFAAGNAVIVKPASVTPMTTLKLAEILIEAGMPRGFLSVLLAGGADAEQVITDPRVRFIAFTGSTEVGKRIQAISGLRRTQMELGSIAFTVLEADADLDRAIPKIVGASYRKAGQVCTSVQIALVHRSLMDQVTERLVEAVGTVKFGDPSGEDVLTGPLISEGEAKRVETWVEAAVASGARRLVGGDRVGAVVPPTLLVDVPQDQNLSCQEVFGPVLCLEPFDTTEEAIARVNSTPFGLATGIFTARIDLAMSYARRLEVGGVHINETSSSRVDLMPYGGSKDSGFGREGPHYAVEEMTEARIVTIST